MAFYDVSTNEKKASPSLVAGGTLYADSPIGTILPYGGASAPSGWFLCDGTAVSRTTYSELFAVIGESFGAGDGSTTFNIPDMRESVPKGAGLTGKTVGAHLDADGLAVGEFLDDRVQEHNHRIRGSVQNLDIGFNTENITGELAGFTYKGIQTQNEIVARNIFNGRTGATTEVKSVGVNYIIKAKMIGVPADFLAKVDEAVAEAITVKKGIWKGSIILQKMGDPQIRDRFDIPITFDSPMPDYNYTVVIEFFESRYVTVMAASKTASGFHIEGANCDNNATSNVTKITWTAIRFPS